MPKYYAVRAGLVPGVYETWEECKKNVMGYKGADYKSFSSLEAAKAYVNNEVKEVDVLEPTAYVDGSFNVNTGEYSFGAVLIIDNKIYRFKKAFQPDEYSSSRNVAGELRGASFIINYAVKMGISKLHLFYDYQGIEKFYDGTWAVSKELTGLYQEFANSIKNKIEIVFHKVKSHSNDYYNDMVDKLAKEALNIS